MTLRVQVNALVDAPGALVEPAVLATLRDAGLGEASVSVTLMDDPAIADLNDVYLDRTGPTDVIAFALHDDDEPPLGDIYIGVDRAGAEAKERGIPLAHELARLAIHGTLHVLGHEHPDEERESSDMWRLQERLLQVVLEEAR